MQLIPEEMAHPRAAFSAARWREPAQASVERVEKELSNSSGVKLLRWKIALTVMMLLFRVARVTLSFTSATPAGAAVLLVSRKAAHCRVSEQTLCLSLEKQATGELQGWPSSGS